MKKKFLERRRRSVCCTVRRIVGFTVISSVWRWWTATNICIPKRIALPKKVADGTLTLAQAKRWVKAMLWDNPVKFYGLE